MPRGEQRSILLHGLIVFALTGGLAVWAAARARLPEEASEPGAVSTAAFLTAFFLMTLFLLAMLKAVKRPAVFEALLTVALLTGGWTVFAAFLPSALALALAAAVVLLRTAWKSVLGSNLSLGVGIAGIAAAVGADLSISAALVVLTMLAFYDIVAVYLTKHMVTMFRELSARGVILAFILPRLRPADLFAPAAGAGSSPSAMLLGTGDVALPAVLAVAALRSGTIPALGAIAGAMAGFALLFFLFLGQPRRRPVPALPPIALGAVAGYGLSLLLP